MPPTILSDDEGETHVAICPICKSKPTAMLLDSVELATLSFQEKAVNDFHLAEAVQCAKQAELTEPSSVAGPSQEPTSTTFKTATPSTLTKRVHVNLEEIFEDDDDDMVMWESAYVNLKCECYNLLLNILTNFNHQQKRNKLRNRRMLTSMVSPSMLLSN
jgi:hypothetical protein